MASGSGVAVEDFTGGSRFDIFHGGSTGDVVGWRFEVGKPIVLTHIGVWDDNGGMGTHQAGIWRDSNQSLLVDVTVTANDPHKAHGSRGYHWVPTPAVTLVPGEVYTIGAMYASGAAGGYISGPTITSSPDVTVLTGVFPAAGSLGFVYPTNSSGTGRFGPNFKYIPSPGALALLAIGGIAAARRRR